MFFLTKEPSHPLSWWYTHRAELDLDPPYQRRGGLWSPYNKARLIDSILNGFDIPKFYIADLAGSRQLGGDLNKRWAVIDGKQRFESVFDFYDNNLRLNRDFTYRDDGRTQAAGMLYADLAAEYSSLANDFDKFVPDVVYVTTDDLNLVKELFVRLNRSVSLTGAEVRNAMRGFVPELIRDLATRPFFTSRIRFATQRGQDWNVAGKLLLLEFRGELVSIKKSDLDRFVHESIANFFPESDYLAAQHGVSEVLEAMAGQFIEHDPLLRSQGRVPIYYWLARHLMPQDLDMLRPFLNTFEQERFEQRARTRLGDAFSLDPELAQYDYFDRSTNDGWSLQGRFEILARRFSHFIEDPGHRSPVSPQVSLLS